MAADHGLTEEQVDIIRRILAPYADVISRVDLYGSRAMGNYRPNSDVDLAVHGDIPEKGVARLRTLFIESSLPVSVDVARYDRISHAPLRAHIDKVRQPLFTQDDLKAAPAAC